ncbi:quinone oxidoreductase family protein [Solirubrobacter soli]|uniref:quinone oxidoreductase family protein n=1 Tax=Solirubrobacter soli TaxID=363832 RepID=UPI00041F7C41|nr:zinc-binding alcohol dehydrogenase family protein [Solirubrobacter soli]
MHAAVVRSFAHPPRYETVDTPRATSADEVVVEVLAAGLHPRVRSSADGSHYTSTDELPLIPGIDGVGRTPTGELLYFVLPDTTQGSMAEQTVVDRRRAVALDPGTDPVTVAAAMNPAMSSWLALTQRIAMEPGSRVLVLGATGNAGRMAIEVARHLGASHVTAAGRDEQRLRTLPADEAVTLEHVEQAAEVDVVLDYLWGEPALRTIRALLTHREDRSRPLDWIQIGSVAGPDVALPSAALRAANLRVMGSGQGSVSTKAILQALPHLAAEISNGTFTVDPQPLPLEQVETAWTAADTRRVVFTPRCW